MNVFISGSTADLDVSNADSIQFFLYLKSRENKRLRNIKQNQEAATIFVNVWNCFRRFPTDIGTEQVQWVPSVRRHRFGHIRSHAQRSERGAARSVELQVSDVLKKKKNEYDT